MMRTSQAAVLVVVTILCLGGANARNLKTLSSIALSMPPPTASESQVGFLSVSEANALADTLIASLETSNDQVIDPKAAEILATAVDGSSGVQASAIILTRLSAYIEEKGCTAPAQNQIQNLLNSEYEGNTFAIVSVLRALDVRTTPIAALGACLQETVAKEPSEVAIKSADGDGN